MWKWLAMAALIYGLMAAVAIISPRSMLAVGALDLAALSKAWQEQGAAPPLHDFERQTPPPFTLPEAPAHVVELDDGNHILSWQPLPDVPLSFLGLPVSAGDPPPKALSVRLRAEGVELAVIGVREADGSLYSAVVPATPEWQRQIRPLARLELAERTVDENNQLDVEQIAAVFIVVKPFAPGQRGPRRPRDSEIQAPPPLIEIDEFGFAPPRPAGRDKPPPDQQQPELGPPDGRPQGRPGRQPPQRREGRPPPGQ